MTAEEETRVRAHLRECEKCAQRDAKLVARLDDQVRQVRKWRVDGGGDAAATQSLEVPRDESPSPSIHIEGYDIIRVLGDGGQGVVYQAVQLSTKRKVAIKVLREGPHASESSRRRFEREIEVVAQLKHHNIIPIFHSGKTPDGHDYCVMDYIRGVPLNHYVRDTKPTLEESLALFSKVCIAVNYAHQKGVIHRDLKPSNILVDAEGEPKLLDFGLAKMVSGPVETLVSITGQVVGTLPYMSPEQTRGNPDEIDIRTDVYALGVMFYEALTGHYPYPVVGGMAEVFKHITDTEPTPPSRQWTADSGVTKRATRSLRAGQCPIDDDLQTIILKTLSKQRDRRYQSAGELAKDFGHYLAGEAIEAKRDSAWYVARMALRKHRMPVALAVLAVATVATLALAGTFIKVQEDRLAASNIWKELAVDPAVAVEAYRLSNRTVQRLFIDAADDVLASSKPQGRALGVRLALFGDDLTERKFWGLVDDEKPLWEHGEWLELCTIGQMDPLAFLPHLKRQAHEGSGQQRYIAFCLLGQLAAPDDDLAGFCARAAQAEEHVGVAAAAWWASCRLNSEQCIDRASLPSAIFDPASRLTYIRIPGCSSFQRGSSPDDPDRFPNEDMIVPGVHIEPFYLSATEVTFDSFQAYVKEEKAAHRISADQEAAWARSIKESSSRPADTAVVAIDFNTAKDFCAWLERKGQAAGSNRKYRLPTEDEWEYACRAGNSGRFCFGNDARYARYFAKCEGIVSWAQIVAERMPNYFGLFDMHGGLWEWCDTRYPPSQMFPPQPKDTIRYVLRGGASYSPAVRCRSAQRHYYAPERYDQYFGFRIVVEFDK